MSTASTTMASVPIPMSVPGTGCRNNCSPNSQDGTTDGDGRKNNSYTDSNFNTKDGSKSLEVSSPFSPSSATTCQETGNNLAIAASLKNKIRSHPHADTPEKGGVSASWIPSNAHVPQFTSSSPSSPLSPSPLSNPLGGVNTQTPHELRKGRPKKRHRHQKTRSRSENDIDSQSTVPCGHLERGTQSMGGSQGAWTMRDVKAYFGIVDGCDSNETPPSDVAEQSPTPIAPVNHKHLGNEGTARDSTGGASGTMVRLPHVRRFIPTAPTSATPPSRKLSTTAVLGSVDITVFLPGMRQPITFHDRPQKQYTKLPDHRPPLRRDKPVRIMLPCQNQGLRDERIHDAGTTSYGGDRLIYPAADRSFIFIPRELRPNQKTSSNSFNRGNASGRGRGRGGGYHHFHGKSLDSSAFHLGMFHSTQHHRRHQQSLATTGRSHHHSFSSCYLGQVAAANRRPSSFGLHSQSPSFASALLPPRPVPGALASFPTQQTQHSSLRFLPGTSELQTSLERQLGIPGPAMVQPNPHTSALSQSFVPGPYPPFSGLEPPVVAAPPPYPRPSHQPIPESSTPFHGPPTGPVPIHQPQPQKRISLPSIISNAQEDTPPPSRRHMQVTPQDSETMQEQRYQIPSPAFSSGAVPHQPLQPFDYTTYPGVPENKASNLEALPSYSQASTYVMQPGLRLPGEFDGNSSTVGCYASSYQHPISGFVMPHTVAHERNGTIYYNYEYGCEGPRFQYPYQPETLPPSSFQGEQPGLPFQALMAGVPATAHVPPVNSPYQSTPSSIAPTTTTSAGAFQVPYQGGQARFGQMLYPPFLPQAPSFPTPTTLPSSFGMNPNMTAHHLASFQSMHPQHLPPASHVPSRTISGSGAQIINP
ncbi:hypothetical protein KEM54_002345 [Ascosphaera aggregata]|nr:hypothetical protein KEM54_002345 [Ascosphaera aggregata]